MKYTKENQQKEKVTRQKSKSQQTSHRPTFSLSHFLLLAGILVLTIIVLSSSITKNFVNLDDPAYVRDNPFIKSFSWQNIRAIFSTFYNANYHPLTTIVYAIEYSLFQLNAAPYHVVNLFVHLVNICLVFVLIDKISQRKWVALITALLFAIHPMHVESVGWLSELKDVLYSCFYLAGLITYHNYLKQKKNTLLIYTFFLFLLSLLSKSAAVTFPLVIVLFDYYYKRGLDKKVITEKVPFFLLSLVFGIVAIYSQQSAGAINADYMVHYTPFQRIFVVSYALVFYLVKLFLPFNLCALYYAPKVLPFYYYICPAIIASLVFLIVKAKQLKSELIFGTLFYVSSIILVIQIIPVGYSVVSERYSYIPYIGLFFIVGSFLQSSIFGAQSSIRLGIIAGAIVLFSVLSYQRGKVWKDSVTLFSDIMQKNPTSPYAPFGLGKVQSENGDDKGAIASFTRSIELDSTFAEVYFYRGNVYYNQKNYDSALNDYLKAVKMKPDYKESFYNIGTVYSVTGRNEQAVENFSKAISIEPNQFMYTRRGTAYFNLKKYAEAADDYTNALKRDSNPSETWYNRGAAYYNLGKNKEACEDWKRALESGYDKANEYINAYCK